VGQTPADVLHRENKWKLMRYRSPLADGPVHGVPILMVPSLINRHYVLDLMPGKSMVEFLLEQGHDVWMIDWGTPGREDRYLSFDDICGGYLGRAVRKVASHSATGKTHLLGYCLGGTLTAIYAAANPEHVESMATLAAPVDFRDDGLLSIWSRIPTLDLDAIIKAWGNMPWPLMQVGFHLLRPTLNLQKAVYAWDRAWDDQFLDGFFALETWGNDNVSFPGLAFKEYIQKLYRENQLVRGEFHLQGRRAVLSNIDFPVLAVTFEHDNIVLPSSAQPLAELVSSDDAENVHMRGGHVGAVVSRKASKGLWPMLSEWYAERSVPPKGKRPVPVESQAS
jgi:polyhydroxyalkanoate synthase